MVSFSEIEEKVPFAISLPTWAPEGYVMPQSAMLRYFDGNLQWVSISWWGPNFADGPIMMLVGPRVNWAVDLDHLQEVQVNGQPATHPRKDWDADTGEWGGAGAGQRDPDLDTRRSDVSVDVARRHRQGANPHGEVHSVTDELIEMKKRTSH